MWTYSQFGLDGTEGERIQRVGINFGAPGDRRAPDGTLWLEYPDTSEGISPGLGITVTGKKATYFRRHPSQISGNGLAWVASSGIIDAEKIIITPNLIKGAMKKPKSSKEKDEDDEKATKAGTTPATETVAEVVKAPAPPPIKRTYTAAPYTVRLHFAEPDERTAGQRVFTVSLQNKPVLQNFDITAAAGGTARTVIKEFQHIIIKDNLTIGLAPTTGLKRGPVICGIELIAETGRE
jgi:hypothetical protein